MRERVQNNNKKKHNSRRKTEEKNKGMAVLPYVSGVSEKLPRIFKKRKISSAMKPHTKLRALLDLPKDKMIPKMEYRMQEKISWGNKKQTRAVPVSVDTGTKRTN